MRIIFFSPNGQPNGPRRRVINYAERLVRSGNDVTIIVKRFSHSSTLNKAQRKQTAEGNCYNGVKIVWVDTVGYESNGVRRLISELQFGIYSIFTCFKHFKKADIVIADSVTPINGICGLISSRLINAKFIHQIRDVWPIALVNDGSLKRFSVTYMIFRALEKIQYRNADWIISALPNVAKHVEASGGDCNHITYLRNGVNLGEFLEVTLQRKARASFEIVYVGTLSFAHDIQTIVTVASKISKIRPNIKFKIYGDGIRRAAAESRVRELGLNNISFFGSVDRVDVPLILANSDALIATVLNSDAYMFGMNLNKLYDYFAASKPVILASPLTQNDVVLADAGVSVPAEDVDSLVNAVLSLADMSEVELQRLGDNARRFAEVNFDVDQLAIQMENLLRKLIKA